MSMYEVSIGENRDKYKDLQLAVQNTQYLIRSGINLNVAAQQSSKTYNVNLKLLLSKI